MLYKGFSRLKTRGSSFKLLLILSLLQISAPSLLRADPIRFDAYQSLTCPLYNATPTSVEQNERDFADIKHQLITSPKLAEKYSRKIIHDLVGDDLAAYLSISPEINVIKVSQPAAFAASNRLIISTGLLEMSNSASEIAFVLAHEMGHLALHHHGAHFTGDRDQMQMEMANELDADQFAVQLLHDSGMEPRAGIAILSRLDHLGTEHGIQARSLFPSIGGRIQALKRQLSD